MVDKYSGVSCETCGLSTSAHYDKITCHLSTAGNYSHRFLNDFCDEWMPSEVVAAMFETRIKMAEDETRIKMAEELKFKTE
jgi:hypothetical protein